MTTIRIAIVTTSCPTCGQDAPKVVRRPATQLATKLSGNLAEECHACLLSRESIPAQNYLRLQWRVLWVHAGGTHGNMPPCLKMPGDPKPAPLPAAPLNPQPARRQRSQVPVVATPDWLPPATILDFPQIHKNRPRILFVSHDMETQGAQRFLLNLLPQLRGMDVAVHTLRDGPLSPLFRQRGIRVFLEVKFDEWDLIAVNTLAAHGAVIRAQEAKRPVVWFCHEWRAEPFLTNERHAQLAQAVRRHVFAHAAQRAQFPHIWSTISTIIPSVVPPVVLPDRTESRRQLGFSPGDFVVLSMGPDEPRKGQADIRQAVEGTTLLPLFVRGQADTSRALAAADVYVASSRAECYPLALQEAKSCRLPVIATRIPVHEDMIEHAGNGLLYAIGDVLTLRSYLFDLRNDEALRFKIANQPIRTPRFDDTVKEYERLLLAEAGGGTAGPDELHVVYHVCGMGERWREIVGEQLDLLERYGLRRILVTHCGEGLDWICQEGRRKGLDLVVCSTTPLLTVFERPAVELIQRLAHVGDKPVLYLHSKGVSHPGKDTFYDEWRKLMQNELIPNWREHLRALDTHDAVGVNWYDANEWWHFSGNFWLAAARWLRQLPPVNAYWKDRFSAERWIGSKSGCNALSLLCRNAAFWDRDRQLLFKLRGEQVQRMKAAGHGA